MARKSVDCREHPSVSGCSVKIEGTEDEVMRIMLRHVVQDHGEEDTPEIREMIRAGLQDVPDEGHSGVAGETQASAGFH